jgi:hypothetical protein
MAKQTTPSQNYLCSIRCNTQRQRERSTFSATVIAALKALWWSLPLRAPLRRRGVIVACIIFQWYFSNIKLIYFIGLTWAHGPAWQTKRGLAGSGNSRASLRVFLNHPFICRATPFANFPCSSLSFTMSKKVTKNTEPETSYAERDIVLAKVRGFPCWPGMVCRVSLLPL